MAATCERKKLNLYQHNIKKVTQKSLSIRFTTAKFLLEHIAENSHDTGVGNNFLAITPKA